jgi:Zn-finger nucleic acid-binding protein
MPTLPCPRCNDHLIPRQEGGLSAHLCPTCGGVFIDHRLAEQTDASHVAGALHRLAADAARRAPFGGSLGVNAVPCPLCRRAMEHSVHARVPVPIDVCAAHGAWFDRGELQRVTERIRVSPYRDAGRMIEPPAARAGAVAPPAAAGVVAPPAAAAPDRPPVSAGASQSGALLLLELIGDLLSD